MSEPSYRLTTEHDPAEWAEYMRWQARVVRLSDGEMVKVAYGPSERDALQTAQAWIAATAIEPETGHVYFATETGEMTPPLDNTEAGHSVRVGA